MQKSAFSEFVFSYQGVAQNAVFARTAEITMMKATVLQGFLRRWFFVLFLGGSGVLSKRYGLLRRGACVLSEHGTVSTGVEMEGRVYRWGGDGVGCVYIACGGVG